MKSILISIFCFFTIGLYAQKDSVIIGNNLVSRTFRFDKSKNGFYSSAFTNLEKKVNYIRKGNEEFAIKVGTVEVTGLNCTYIKHSLSSQNNIQTLKVDLATAVKGINVQLIYTVYDNIPLIRKQLLVINNSKAEVPMCDLDIERLNIEVVNTYMNEVYANYGTNLTRIPYKGDYNDAAVLLFNLNEQQGLLFGNESPSVLKRTEIYVNEGKVQMGLGLQNESFPFKKWLKPAEVFTSPKTFIYVSNSGKWQDAFEGKYQDFIRNYLGVKLYQQKNKPFFIYNTWQPFFDKINENIVKGCADNLEKIGTDLFIIDAGWYKRAGDFNVDITKFPNGLKTVCEYIRSKNMRVGLWFTIGSVHAKSEVAKQHPEWIIKDKNGRPANLHQAKYEEDGNVWDSAIRTMSMGSPYFDHIKNIIWDYVKIWGISYLKLDLSIANSAYVNNLEATGDYDLNNPSKLYIDRASSYWVIYERTMKLMDDIHAEFPDMLLDCTFEVWGRYNLVDYALIEHGDYDWLTNFDFKQPAGPISIRQMSYDRSRVVPTSTLLIGNQFIDSDNYPYVYFSMVSTSALMVGDPRKLNSKEMDFYTKWNSWFKEIEDKYQFSKYRQVYDIFDRPTDNNWDGNYRININKSGGLMFFFRNNSSDTSRTFKIPCLNPDFSYRIYSHEDGKVIGSYKGKELINVGVSISIPTTYSAKVLLIEKEKEN